MAKVSFLFIDSIITVAESLRVFYFTLSLGKSLILQEHHSILEYFYEIVNTSRFL